MAEHRKIIQLERQAYLMMFLSIFGMITLVVGIALVTLGVINYFDEDMSQDFQLAGFLTLGLGVAILLAGCITFHIVLKKRQKLLMMQKSRSIHSVVRSDGHPFFTLRPILHVFRARHPTPEPPAPEVEKQPVNKRPEQARAEASKLLTLQEQLELQARTERLRMSNSIPATINVMPGQVTS